MSKQLKCTLALALLVAVSPSDSRAADCGSGVTATGRAAHPENFDPPRKYNAEALAKKNAQAEWRAAVRQSCPGFSSYWWMSRKRSVICEGYAGGISCEATATPLRLRL